MAVIRRRQGTLWDAIREAPRDWVLHLAEDYELIDWARVSEATSWPCALVLNGLFVLVSMARQIGAQADTVDVLVGSDRRRWSRRDGQGGDDSQASTAGSTVASALLFLHVSLYIVSIANAVRLFGSKRVYQLRMADIDVASLTSNCRRVALGAQRPGWARPFAGRCLWAIWRWVSRADEQGEDEIWELLLWTPPTFSRNVFCWYSPVQLLVLSFMDGSNWYYILPLAAAVAVQCTFVVMAYSTLVKDKQILFGEVHNEYNQKFVHPRVFVPRADAATSTDTDLLQARRAAGGLGPSGIAINRERVEQIKRQETARRRATALGTENAIHHDYMAREPYQGAPRYRPAQERKSMPMAYSSAANAREYARSCYTADADAEHDRLNAGQRRLAQERKSVSMPYGGAAASNGYPRPRAAAAAAAAAADTAARRLYEDRPSTRHSIAGQRSEVQVPAAEPIGTYPFRDRSSYRRRHTAILESPGRNEYTK